MADRSKIEWTDATWNPIRARAWQIQDDSSGKERIGWHCEHVSEGCRNCYAESFNMRLGTGFEYKPGNLRGRVGYAGGGTDRPEIFLDEKTLLAPLPWKKPRKIFVCSMTDIFGEFVPDALVDRIFVAMARAHHHTFQVLTKRPQRMREYVSRTRLVEFDWPLPNVWLGTTAEDQPTADARIPELLATPAAKRFVSIEPMLGAVDLTHLRYDNGCHAEHHNSLSGISTDTPAGFLIKGAPPDRFSRGRVDWTICGGESGPHARPMHPDWARSLRDQCAAAGTAFFFKQWGEWRPPLTEQEAYDTSKGRAGNPPAFLVSKSDGSVHCYQSDHISGASVALRVGKSRAGRLLDGREHNAFPEVR